MANDPKKQPSFIASPVVGDNYVGSPDHQVLQLVGYVDVSYSFGMPQFDSFTILRQGHNAQFLGSTEIVSESVEDALWMLGNVAAVLNDERYPSHHFKMIVDQLRMSQQKAAVEAAHDQIRAGAGDWAGQESGT